jgi:UDP-N-acetylglucosamine:LPS N-acetylglucosamine transferase
MLPDADLGEKLVPKVLALLGDEQALAGMRESANAMARPDAAEMIAEQLWTLAKRRAALEFSASGDGEGRVGAAQ